MALKITTPIGTDKGITDEAYVRISSYNIHRAGIATFNIEIFESESIAKERSFALLSSFAKNSQIGETISVPLHKEIIDENGNTFVTPDLSPAIGVDIFTFGYAQLKIKLQDLFGEKNVIDC